MVSWQLPTDVNSHHVESPFQVLVEDRRAAEAVDCVSLVLAILIINTAKLNLKMLDLILLSVLPILQRIAPNQQLLPAPHLLPLRFS